MRTLVTLLASMTLLDAFAPRPAMAEPGLGGHHVVTLTEVERFQGGMAPVTVACPLVGTCTARVRIAVRGEPHEYSLIVSAPRGRARISLLFLPTRAVAPRLDLGRGDTIDVELRPDGTGLRHVAATALGSGYKYPGFAPPEPARTPLANIRVTVHREDAAPQSR